MTPAFPLIFLSLFLSMTLACHKQETEVTMDIQVKTNKGEVVDSADVLVNDILVGSTDTTGRLVVKKNFPPLSRQKIEIYKNSDKFYYARHVDSFQVAEQSAQQLNLMATLYYAPKPTEADASLLSEEIPKGGALPQEEVVAENTPQSEPEVVEQDNDESDITVSLAAKAPEVKAEKIPPAPKEELSLTPVADLSDKNNINTTHFANTKSPIGQELTHTVHVHSGKEPVADAVVMYGTKHATSFEEGCKTNARGRCLLRFVNKPGEMMTLLIKKQGFHSSQQTIRVQPKGITRFNIRSGESIDVFTFQKRYNDISGLSGVQVYIDNKRVGSTDKFGHFSYLYPGKSSDLVQVTLKTSDGLPEVYDTDFVVSGPMTLTRYYTPKAPPPVKMTLLRAQPGGDATPAQMRAFDGSLDRALEAAAQKSLFSLTAFSKYPTASFLDAASRAGRTLGQMVKKGWVGTDIKSSVDIAVVPTVVFNRSKNITLELAMVDSKGQVIAAGKEVLESIEDRAAIMQAMRSITEKIVRIYPFEGAVIAKEDSEIKINLGYSSGRGVQKNDELLVYGIQSDKMGRKQNYEQIATLKVTRVEDQAAYAQIANQKPRSLVQAGDLVVLHSRTHEVAKKSQIRVIGKGKGNKTEAIEQANVYFNNTWIGATDNDGRLYFEKQDMGGKGLLKVIHYGYRDYTQEINLTNRRIYEVALIREMAFVRVDSNPQGAKVLIEGDTVGQTPLYTPIPVPSGFVKLEIMGPQGYKTFTNVVELERGTLDLTGANKVNLEQDYRSLAMKRLEAGEFQAAIKRLEEIPVGHSDYLRAQHEIGEIYLQKLKDPAKAAAAFGRVTSDKGVAQFTDKRFIGTHINEGIALFLTAENLRNQDQATAQAHYLKAIEKIEVVAPQVRFVPKTQFNQAVQNIGYYRALAYHQLWNQTKDKLYLNQAYKSWREYMEQLASIPASESVKTLQANADVYFKQAKASLGAVNLNETEAMAH